MCYYMHGKKSRKTCPKLFPVMISGDHGVLWAFLLSMISFCVPFAISLCGRLNNGPKISRLETLAPGNVTLYGKRGFADVIK